MSAGGGDRDISWGLRDLTTQLRRHPKIQGFVYTELTDIEWEHNGLVNYDRTPKVFGYDTWLPDMRPNELHGRRLHRLRRAAGDRGQAGRDDLRADLREPLFGAVASGEGAMVGQRLRFQGGYPHRGRAAELPDHLAAV